MSMAVKNQLQTPEASSKLPIDSYSCKRVIIDEMIARYVVRVNWFMDTLRL
jgi:hypothetical protein